MPAARQATSESSRAGTRRAWRFAIDTGGTFTDCIAEAPDGSIHRRKVLSSGRLRGRLILDDSGARLDLAMPPASQTMRGAICRHLASGRTATIVEFDPASGRLAFEGDAVLSEGICEVDFGCAAPRLVMAIVLGISPDTISEPCAVRIATTRGTNALLEGRTARPLLVVDRGFADLLRIGDQTRPDLFARSIEDRRPLHGSVIEVDLRRDADGRPVEAVVQLDESALRRRLEALVSQGTDAAAIALLHAHRDPSVEVRRRSSTDGSR